MKDIDSFSSQSLCRRVSCDRIVHIAAIAHNDTHLGMLRQRVWCCAFAYAMPGSVQNLGKLGHGWKPGVLRLVLFALG